MTQPKVIAVVGPTASGKTSLSIEIAQRFGGEVISADSRQIYRGMDIGTGKITTAEMKGVTHHLLDVAEPTQVYSASDFARDATDAIEEILNCVRCPIIAGGSFFYLDQLRGKSQSAPVEPDEAFRNSLKDYSNATLLETLHAKDPARAAAIDPHNRRRLIRALEIVHTLGAVPPPAPAHSPYDWLIIGLTTTKDQLLSNYQKRITEWLKSGFAEETARLSSEVSPARFAELGFEYTLMAEHLDGHLTQDELIERFVQKNWQYAKRQLTWLKRDEEIIWEMPENRSAIFRHVEQFLKKS